MQAADDQPLMQQPSSEPGRSYSRAADEPTTCRSCRCECLDCLVLTLAADELRWLPCTRDLRPYCQCSCKSAAFTATDAGATALVTKQTTVDVPLMQVRVARLPRRRRATDVPLMQVGVLPFSRTHASRRLGWLPCTRDLRPYCPDAAATALVVGCPPSTCAL